MALATTNETGIGVANLVLQGFRKASLVGEYEQLSSERQMAGLKELDLVTKHLHTEGLFAMVKEFETILLQTGIFQYPVSSSALDIIGPGMFIDVSQSDITKASGETPVIPMLMEEWHTLSAKDASSRPQRYYLHRDTTPPVVYLWPIPSATENGAHVRLIKHRLRATSSQANTSLDFELFWEQALVYALAHELALNGGLPLDRVQYLAMQRDLKLAKCKGYAKPRPPQQFVMRHPTRSRGSQHR